VLKEFQRAQRLAVERESAYAPFISSSLLPSRSLLFLVGLNYKNGSLKHHPISIIFTVRLLIMDIIYYTMLVLASNSFGNR
jgi:hypothetical protein